MNAARRAARDNGWIASQLEELAARLELEGEPHRPRAYRRAADTIRQSRVSVAELRESQGIEGLDRLPGIGPHIASIVRELVDSGHAKRLDQMREKTPVDVLNLLAVDGIGGKTLRVLWEELGVRTLADLESALEDGRVETLPGFAQRRVERLRQAVRIQQHGRPRVPWKKAAAIANRLRDAIEKHPSVTACAVAGSVRRGRPTVGDIDLVAASTDPSAAAACLLDRPEVEHVYSRGPHRSSVRLKSGVDVDLRTVPARSFGSALLYFTGSRVHTLALRRLALAYGLRLNEYGLFRGQRRIAGETEAGIYAALSLPYLPPDQRETEPRRSDAAEGTDQA